LAEAGIEVVEVRDIGYGKQWSVKHGLAVGEANVFYGKKGFSVCKSSKRATLEELNELLTDVITVTLYNLEREKLPIEEGEMAPDDPF
jgi:hypothetical protein